MHVLFWTNPTAFQAPGGGETILLRTRESLEAAGVEVDLFDPWKTKLRDYPLVHCFHSASPDFWEAVKEAGARLVVTPTHWPTTDARIRFWRSLKKRARRLAGVAGPYKDIEYFFGLADALLPSSETEAGLLERYCGVPREKMTVVRNGADARFFAASPAPFVRRFGLRDFVLCAARIIPRKNQLRIVRALRSCPFPVALVGAPDPDALDYFEQCRREAGPNVHFLGPLDHASPLLPSAMAAARVFLMPSEVDIAPVAVVEAAAAGCRLVVTPVGSAREYYGDGALYVDPTSEADIRAKTEAAYLRGRMGADEPARRVPTWADAARRVMQVYERLLAGEPAHLRRTGINGSPPRSATRPAALGSDGRA